MSWWSKKVKKHMGKVAGITLGAIAGALTGGTAAWLPYMLIGGTAGGFAGHGADTQAEAARLQKQQNEEVKKQAEEQKKATLAAAEAESINADRAARKIKSRFGRASTVLGADYRTQAGGAAKRLLGE